MSRRVRKMEKTEGGPDANARQVGGDHYKQCVIEPWDYIAANGLDFFTGNAVKYITRFAVNGQVENLKKAEHYLQKRIELEK